jgi:hypothetical protein
MRRSAVRNRGDESALAVVESSPQSSLSPLAAKALFISVVLEQMREEFKLRPSREVVRA